MISVLNDRIIRTASATRIAGDEALPACLEARVTSRDPLTLDLQAPGLSSAPRGFVLLVIVMAATGAVAGSLCFAAGVSWLNSLGIGVLPAVVTVAFVALLGGESIVLAMAPRKEIRFEPSRLLVTRVSRRGKSRTEVLSRSDVSCVLVKDPGIGGGSLRSVQIVRKSSAAALAIGPGLREEMQALVTVLRRWAEWELVPAPEGEALAGDDSARQQTVVSGRLSCPACDAELALPDRDARISRVRCAMCDQRFDVVPRAVGEGPLREQRAYELIVGEPAPPGFRDISDGEWFRRVAIGRPLRAPRFPRLALLALGLCVLVVVSLALFATVLLFRALDFSVFFVVLGVGVLVGRMIVAGIKLPRREEVAMSDSALQWTLQIGPYYRVRRIPLISPSEVTLIVGTSKAPSSLSFEIVPRSFLAIPLPPPETGLWRVALGRSAASVSWLKEYLRSGLELIKRAHPKQ